MAKCTTKPAESKLVRKGEDGRSKVRHRPKLYIGLDVHKDTVVVSVLPETGKPVGEKKLNHEYKALRKYFDQLRDEHQATLHMAYEAGVCGYALCRKIRAWGYDCQILAPSRMPQAPGDKKRKTDKRDAYKIARALRAEELSFVRIPDEEDEGARDLIRLRKQIKKDQIRHRHHLSKFLLRKGIHYGGRNWSKAHEAWLKEQKLPTAAEQMVYDACRKQIVEDAQRLNTIDGEIQKLSLHPRYAPAVSVCRAYRGIEVLAAMVLVLEIGDYRRFPTAPALMSFLGLTASEFTSGDTPRRGRITRAGNSYCRHVLIQASWHYMRSLSKSETVTKRRAGLPEWAVAHAVKAEKRLHKRFLALNQRLPSEKAAVAVARELAGFIWASMVELENGGPLAQQSA